MHSCCSENRHYFLVLVLVIVLVIVIDLSYSYTAHQFSWFLGAPIGA